MTSAGTSTVNDSISLSASGDGDILGMSGEIIVRPGSDDVLGKILVRGRIRLGTDTLDSSRGGLDAGNGGILHDALGARSGSGDRSSDDYLHVVWNTCGGSTALGNGGGILGRVLSNSRGVLVVFVLSMGDSAMHLHGATPSAEEEDLAVDTGMVDDLDLMLLLPIYHHVEALDTMVTHKLEELGMMIKFAAQVGQAHRLSA
jgi:hypothetical protein